MNRSLSVSSGATTGVSTDLGSAFSCSTRTRSRSLNDLPGGLRVPVLKRPERLKPRIQATLAGLEELRLLKEQQRNLVDEAKLGLKTRLVVGVGRSDMKDLFIKQTYEWLSTCQDRLSVSNLEVICEESGKEEKPAVPFRCHRKSADSKMALTHLRPQIKRPLSVSGYPTMEQSRRTSEFCHDFKPSRHVAMATGRPEKSKNADKLTTMRRASFQCHVVLTKQKDPVPHWSANHEYPSPMHAVMRQYQPKIEDDKERIRKSGSVEKDSKESRPPRPREGKDRVSVVRRSSFTARPRRTEDSGTTSFRSRRIPCDEESAPSERIDSNCSSVDEKKLNDQFKQSRNNRCRDSVSLIEGPLEKSKSPSVLKDLAPLREQSLDLSQNPSVLTESLPLTEQPLDKSKNPTALIKDNSALIKDQLSYKSEHPCVLIDSVSLEQPLYKSKNPTVLIDSVSLEQPLYKSKNPTVLKESTPIKDQPSYKSEHPCVLIDSVSLEQPLYKSKNSTVLKESTPIKDQLLEKSQNPCVFKGSVLIKGQSLYKSQNPTVLIDSVSLEQPLYKSKNPTALKESTPIRDQPSYKSEHPCVLIDSVSLEQPLYKSKNPTVLKESTPIKDQPSYKSEHPCVLIDSVSFEQPLYKSKNPTVLKESTLIKDQLLEKSQNPCVFKGSVLIKGQPLSKSKNPTVLKDSVPIKDQPLDKSQNPSVLTESLKKQPLDKSKNPCVLNDSAPLSEQTGDKSRKPTVLRQESFNSKPRAHLETTHITEARDGVSSPIQKNPKDPARTPKQPQTAKDSREELQITNSSGSKILQDYQNLKDMEQDRFWKTEPNRTNHPRITDNQTRIASPPNPIDKNKNNLNSRGDTCSFTSDEGYCASLSSLLSSRRQLSIQSDASWISADIEDIRSCDLNAAHSDASCSNDIVHNTHAQKVSRKSSLSRCKNNITTAHAPKVLPFRQTSL